MLDGLGAGFHRAVIGSLRVSWGSVGSEFVCLFFSIRCHLGSCRFVIMFSGLLSCTIHALQGLYRVFLGCGVQDSRLRKYCSPNRTHRSRKGSLKGLCWPPDEAKFPAEPLATLRKHASCLTHPDRLKPKAVNPQPYLE